MANTVNISERIPDVRSIYRAIMDGTSREIRVAGPGTIEQVNTNQTVSVQLSLRELIKDENDRLEWVTIPLLVDVPICMFRSGGFMITLPYEVGDEVLVIFSDSCIDSWWQSGGVQNQIDRRRHDLSDGFALPIIWNHTRLVTDYSSDSLQIRNEDGSTVIEVSDGTVKVTAGTVELSNASSLYKLMDERFAAYYDAHIHTVGGVNSSTPTVPVSALLATIATTKTKAG